MKPTRDEAAPARRRRAPSPVFLALLLAVGAVAWILSGQFGTANAPGQAPDRPAAETASRAAGPTPLAVRVRTLTAATRLSEIVLRGRTMASRSVDLRAQTAGRVKEIAAARAARVRQGDVILRLALDDRPARLRQARALVAQRRAEYEAARKLNRKGFRGATKLAEAKAYLDAARASLASIEVDIEHTVVKAPFEGVLDARPVEIGDFVEVGDTVGRIVDLDPAIVMGQISERDVGRVEIGSYGRAKLVTGHEVKGVVRYISAVGDDKTRTFRLELEVPNGDGRVVDGVTAEVFLPVDRARAHLVSPAVLTLADDGTVGVKIVNDEDVVEFRPANIVDDTQAGVWLGGLPETIRIITVGQEYVMPGQKVAPREDTAGGRS